MLFSCAAHLYRGGVCPCRSLGAAVFDAAGQPIRLKPPALDVVQPGLMREDGIIGTVPDYIGTSGISTVDMNGGGVAEIVVGHTGYTNPTDMACGDVPVYVRDVSGTPLGRDRALGDRVQGVSLLVTPSPSSSVTSATFTRAGVLLLTPLYERATQTTGTAGLLASFRESTSLLAFTSNKPGNGDRIATLRLTIPAGIPSGSRITLTPSPAATTLSNQAGTKARRPRTSPFRRAPSRSAPTGATRTATASSTSSTWWSWRATSSGTSPRVSRPSSRRQPP